MEEEQQQQQQKQAAATLVCNLEGTLLRSQSFFPYYMLVALEAGGPLRAFLLLLLSPFTWLLETFFSAHSASIRLQVFVSTAGLRYSEVRAVSRAVLPKFFLEDLHPPAYRALMHHTSSSLVVLSSHPKIFLDHFLSVHLRVRSILAADLLVSNSGFCTGLLSLSTPGFLDENAKLLALRQLVCSRSGGAGGAVPALPRPLVGLMRGGGTSPHLFLSHCKDIVVLPDSSTEQSESVPREQYVSPLVFHDGRLVMRPTPFTCVVILLWMPIGIVLAMTRIMVGLTVRGSLVYPITSLLGLKLRVKGAPPLLERSESGDDQRQGVLFVCTHRTLADPTFLAMALRRKVRALAYSVSRVSEMITPIKATRLTRNREEDAKIIDELLKKEDVFVCPEGTTCREPFLLRFSPLFADLADRIVPVALDARMSVFQGTTARGYKFLDGFFFLMNPRPSYHIAFLDPVPIRHLRSLGKTSIDIANTVQKQLAAELGYQCTNFSRRDKYNLLAGNDGKA